ncbi:hypothetical protein ACSNOI_40990 [Actinomadura kijaniata]|uniref:hypothetical protein n=1 Tax=Actinomadura kijaniata TaxID=46161 RepID=UPI003F1DFF52
MQDEDRLVERLKDRVFGRCDTRVWLSNQSWSQVESSWDVPRHQRRPPATPVQVDAVEAVLGRPLPQLLRRIYTEIASGGIGPGPSGFTPLTTDPAMPGRQSLLESAVADPHTGHPQWVTLVRGGCAQDYYLSLTAPHPVCYVDWNLAPAHLPDPWPLEQCVMHVTATLNQWLWQWAQGRHLLLNEYGLWRGQEDFPFAAAPLSFTDLPSDAPHAPPPVQDPWGPETAQT